MIKLATLSEIEEATGEAENSGDSGQITTLTVLADDDPRGAEYPVDESNDDDGEEEELTSEFDGDEEGESEGEGAEQAAPVDVKDESPADAPAPAPPEKILQLPDEVRARDLALIEAHQNDLREQRQEVRRRFTQWSLAKEEAKECKSSYDESVSKLLSMIDEGPQRQHTLFNTEATPQAAEPASTPALAPAPSEQPTSSTTDPPSPPVYEFPGWRDTSIGEFCHGDVSPGLAEILADMKMTTVGQLADFLDGDRVSTYLTDAQADALRAEIAVCKMTSQKPKATPPADDDSWREISVDELDLPKSLKEKLKEQDFETVGHIADFTSKGKNLTDIRGIGEKKADQLQDALEKVWASRSEETSE